MRTSTALVPVLAIAALAAMPVSSRAQTGIALTGKVTSAEEGAMEGVLVSARKEGSPLTVTVVSDQKGSFGFPAAKLEPGKYTLSIRAVGYDLQGARTVDVVGSEPAKAEIKLVKTKNLSRQLSNGEWIMSVPGNEQQKLSLLNCVTCARWQEAYSRRASPACMRASAGLSSVSTRPHCAPMIWMSMVGPRVY